MSARTHRTLTPVLVAICALLGGLAVAGCGGSGSDSGSGSGSTAGSHTSSSAAALAGAPTGSAHSDVVTSRAKPHHAARTPARSNPDVGSATKQRTHRTGGSHTDAGAGAGLGSAHSTDRIVRSGTHQKAQLVSVGNDDDGNATSTHQLNPCTLVSLSEAQAFTGGAVSNRFEALQGPTCIYRTGNAKTEITMAVQSVVASQLTSHLAQRQKVTVDGRAAYCGKLGAKLLVVPLPGNQMLSVSAPCSVARQFAATAVSRLAA
jgi:hypothetical protein